MSKENLEIQFVSDKKQQTASEAFQALIAAGQWTTDNESKPYNGFDYLWENLSAAIIADKLKKQKPFTIKPFNCGNGISRLALHYSNGDICPGQLSINVSNEHDGLPIIVIESYIGPYSIFRFEESSDDS